MFPTIKASMKTMKFATLLLVSALAGAAPSAFAQEADQPTARPKPVYKGTPAAILAKKKLDLSQEINNLNSMGAQTPFQNELIHSVAKHAGVPPATLEAQKKKTTMGWGELLVANAVATASQVKFDQLRAERRTRSWADVALAHKVDLATLVEKLRAVQDEVDDAADKQIRAEQQRIEAEQRRMMQRLPPHMRPPPPPPPPPQNPEN